MQDSERARALEQALRELTAMVRGECPSLLNEDSGGNGDLSYQIEKLLAVHPPSGASPQAETLGDAVSALWRALCEGDGKHSEMLDRSIIAAHLERYAAQKPAPVSPVEPEPPTLEPCAHELDYHNCAECVGLKVEPEPPICSDPHLLKRGCECASCLDPVRLKRQLLEVWEKYRAFVDAVASALHVESERGPVSEVSVIEAARDTLNQLLDSPTVEPEPCAWRITSGPLGTWANPTCVEGAIPAPWGTERAKACHLCGAPLKVEREP